MVLFYGMIYSRSTSAGKREAHGRYITSHVEHLLVRRKVRVAWCNSSWQEGRITNPRPNSHVELVDRSIHIIHVAKHLRKNTQSLLTLAEFLTSSFGHSRTCPCDRCRHLKLRMPKPALAHEHVTFRSACRNVRVRIEAAA